MSEKNDVIPVGIVEEFYNDCHVIATEYHIPTDICALFKTRDLIIIKKTGPDSGKKKKVLSWMKKTKAEIEEILSWQEWR